MKIVSCVFPIALGKPSKNAETIKKIAEETPGDIYLFPAYALGGVSCGKIKDLPSFKSEAEKAIDILCDYTENNDKCIVTSTFADGNIAIYGGDVNKTGKFKKGQKTVSVSQSGKDSADIILIPAAMPSYPGIKNDVSEFCAEISRQKNCVVAVANAGYGESSADDVFRGFCGVFNKGTITAFTGEDKPESVVAAADTEKTDGIVYSRPKRAAGKIPYYANTDTSVYISELVQMQKQALYTRAAAMSAKKLFVDGDENTETFLALYILSETAKVLKMKSEKVTVFTSSDAVLSLAAKYGFTVKSAPDGLRKRKAEILDEADKEKALLAGTLPLSEIAYGKVSLFGENICHYNINATLPRTVLWDAVKQVFKDDEKTLETVLSLVEKEKNSGVKYDMCDFWLYYFAKHRSGYENLKNYALATFEEYDDDEIISALDGFTADYKKNQPVRSASSEGANLMGFVLPYIPADADYSI